MNKKGNQQKQTIFKKIDYSELVFNSDYHKVFIDYIKFAIDTESPFMEMYLELLKSANSDASIIEIEGLPISINLFNGKFGRGLSFTVAYNSIPVELCVVQSMEKNVFKGDCKYIIEFKGQYFRLEEMGFITEGFYKKVIHHIFGNVNPRITRLDRTIDFIQEKKQKDKKLYMVSPVQFFGESLRKNALCHSYQNGESIRLSVAGGWGKLEKIDYGNRYYGTRKSKTVYFRMYDKKKDILAKKKDLLYIDYLKFEKVVRCEFECDYKFCYGYNLDTLNSLLQKCDSVFHISEKEWKGSTCYNYNRENNIIDLSAKTDAFKSRYIDTFNHMGFTIYENDINSFSSLALSILSKSQFVSYDKTKIQQYLKDTIKLLD